MVRRFDAAAVEGVAAVGAADSANWRERGSRLGCHVAPAELAVAHLAEVKPGGATVRIQRMAPVVRVFREACVVRDAHAAFDPPVSTLPPHRSNP